MWDLWWTDWHWDRFFPEYFGFPLSVHSTSAPLLGKRKKKYSSSSQGCTINLKAAVCP
jgi:hypothetical protein